VPNNDDDNGCSTVVCCVVSGLFDGLITRLEESHRVCVSLILCVLGTPKRRPRTDFGCCATKKIAYIQQKIQFLQSRAKRHRR